VLLAAGHGGSALAAEPAAAPPGCASDGTLEFVCGPKNAEDIVRLGATRWLIASGMDGGLTASVTANGKLYLIDHRAKSWREAFPGNAPVFRQDRTLFGGCPAALDTKNFSAHGIALREQRSGHYRLYVVGHGTREAIEVFDVDATAATPTFTWTGCVVLPADVSANSVAILPDWGFVVTKFLDRSLPQQEAIAQMRSGKPNGVVYEWHPGGQLKPIAGTELSAPNGIEVSPDGNTLYVAAFGSREVVRFRRGAGALKKDVVKLDITPDNVRWSSNGKLLAAGGNAPAAGATAGVGWGVVEIDPQTLATRRLAGGASSNGMQTISVGTDVEGEVWIGTFSGDRVGYQKIH
jgi:DNA-binding beta-propeller fold protein YncE